MTGGDLVADVLARRGVKFLFTLCGGHISPILVSARRRGIRVIDVRDEAAAAFAADAVSRLTGTPGVAAVTAGPGVTNTLTAVKNAQLAQSPLVLVAFLYHLATTVASDWRKTGPARHLIMGRYVMTLLAFCACAAAAALGALPTSPWALDPPEEIFWGAGPTGRYDLVPVFGASYFLARAVLGATLSPLGKDNAFKRWVAGMGSAAG